MLAEDGLCVVCVDDVALVPSPLDTAWLDAVVISAKHLGLREWLAIHQLCKRSPATLLVLVTTARMKDAPIGDTERRIPRSIFGRDRTVVLPWPVDVAELKGVLRRAAPVAAAR